ncbi:MAG: Spy/CpxP family protein refolding chaperone [Deltaproteobacteria bacterium]|nr:Spy/CpxP family protein refolding chaperone [Deltaproteobacteria bacterium]
MKRSWIVLILSTVLLTLALSSCGFSGKRWYKMTPEERGAYFVEKMTKELDLTPDQVTKLEKLKVEFLANQSTHFQGRQAHHQAIMDQFRSDRIDIEQLKAQMQEHHLGQGQRMDFMLEKLQEFHLILTPDQRNKLADHMLERSNWGHGHGHGGGFGHGPGNGFCGGGMW